MGQDYVYGEVRYSRVSLVPQSNQPFCPCVTGQRRLALHSGVCGPSALVERMLHRKLEEATGQDGLPVTESEPLFS